MRIALLFLFFSSSLFAQNQYPKDYFRSPLDIPIHLSGNFGELRSNHFHAGFDIKTQKREGLNVFAVADGYVSRIKISAFGYGKAIYITHPNGFTSVYGHLRTGSWVIEKFIKAQHYKEKSFEIDIFLKPEDLPVKKGDIIAFSGNTGGSEGPHLHFEIRDSKTEKTINPMFFGYDSLFPDKKKPIVTNLLLYPLGENTVVNQSVNPFLLNLTLQSDGNYLAEKVYANGKIGFGITTHDINMAWDKNGVFKIESFLNGKLSFGYQFDTFSFDETSYINALIDYPRFKKTGQRIQQLFMNNPYSLSILKTDANFGVVEVDNNATLLYRIEVSDFNGNTSIISVPIQFDNRPALDTLKTKKTPYQIKKGKEYNFEKGKWSVAIPPDTFYNDFFLNFDVKSDTLYFHNESTPVHNSFVVSVQDSIIASKDDKKYFIASVEAKRLKFNKTKLKGNTYTAYSKNLGPFILTKDTTPPKIALSINKKTKKPNLLNSIKLTISDSLSGINEYNGYLNGQWILFEYDYKSKTLTHNFNDGIVVNGKNELKVIVTDNVGNLATFETEFFRTQK
ncbi:MAG: M23 family metallopeptidase [Bacteroidota bacterium]